MYYSININQLAIATHNKTYNTNIDLIDGVILEYLQKQSISTFAKRNYIIHQGEIYYMICYDNIITQLPLLNITSKEVIGRRLKKMAEYGIIQKYVDRKNMNKTYFTTTELFETFFTYLPTQKSPPSDSKVVSLPTQKSDHIIDNNINDNNINDKNKDASAFSSSQFDEFWNEYGKKVKKPKTEESYKKALKQKDTTHQSIMNGVKKYNEYLNVATWLEKADPTSWLNQGRWNDDYDDLIKQEYKKQGKTPPVQQKSPEKQQEEVKMNEDAQRKRESILKHLNGDETQFMNDIKEVLKSNFTNPLHHFWIYDFIFSCRNKVAYFGFTEQKHIDTVNRNFVKFEQIIMREIASTELVKEGENLTIELKLID